MPASTPWQPPLGLRALRACDHSGHGLHAIAAMAEVAEPTLLRLIAGFPTAPEPLDRLAQVLSVPAVWLREGRDTPDWAAPAIESVSDLPGFLEWWMTANREDLAGLATLITTPIEYLVSLFEGWLHLRTIRFLPRWKAIDWVAKLELSFQQESILLRDLRFVMRKARDTTDSERMGHGLAIVRSRPQLRTIFRGILGNLMNPEQPTPAYEKRREFLLRVLEALMT